ncbi:Leucine-rich repeat,Leucine-rich repeat domain, L domain-like [Cinara cedri]|uniref:Leucine-rich repeat,Leucine-rich repeat domain, L domain-like n=1 Tax=Cinara cedri TaxID=506608 RepID=A0A5E4NI15_9HEMI|nr:Leucine-rich repeat,Leucine-rich repeat domain, L domain-like [Cinara cedri]
MDPYLDEINNNTRNMGITTLLEDTVKNKNLDQITSLKLQAPMSVNRLCMLGTYVPNLVELDLTDSFLLSFRDFAFKLDNLKILKVASCNLKTLDGVWNIPNVEELYAPDNEISDLMLCSTLVKLVTLDLSRNKIMDLTKLHFLNFCEQLQNVSLSGCPVAKMDNFDKKVHAILPNLNQLNGNQTLNIEEIEKPKLTIESIVCGNITAALRKRKITNNGNKVTKI